MPQTTGSVSKALGRIEISTDLTTWVNVSGSSQSITSTEQERNTGDEHTLDGDVPLSEGGKRNAMDIDFNIVYTEVAGEAYELVRAAFENANTLGGIYVRWVPKGGTSGTAAMYRTPITKAATLKTFKYPDVDANGAGPIMGMFRVHTPEIQKTSASNTSGGSGT